MKLLSKNLKEGRITLSPDTLEDLWHLEHVILPGDLVSASSMRRLKVKGREEKQEKKPVFLTIEVTQVEFHKHSNTLRILGVIKSGKPEDLINLGEHHTIEVTPSSKIKIEKQWKQFELERLNKAVEESKQVKMLLVSIDDKEAVLGVLTSIGVEFGPVIFSDRGGKRYADKQGKNDYHERVFKAMHSYPVEKALIVGPGFEKDEFQKYLKENEANFLKKCLFEKTKDGGRQGIQELLREGLIESVIQDHEVSKQNEYLQEFLKRLSKDGAIAYGLNEVARAAKSGAVSHALVLDSFLREERASVEPVLEGIEKNQGTIHLVLSDSDVGKQVKGLGKIIALLRYKF